VKYKVDLTSGVPLNTLFQLQIVLDEKSVDSEPTTRGKAFNDAKNCVPKFF